MNGETKKQAIHEVLEALAAKHGHITPDLVVTEAQNPDSPLHGEFEWDDRKAAIAFRVEQARALIQRHRLYVEHQTGVIVSPAWVRDPEAESGEQGYTSVAELRTDRDRAMAALVNEVGRAAAHLARCRNLAAGLGLSDEVDGVVARFEVFRASLDTGAPVK
jgi:hypothetical protein